MNGENHCPLQRAFVQKLNYLFSVRDDVYWRSDIKNLEHYHEVYNEFVNNWCPILKEYEPIEIGKD
jgi:hypothetical protein